MPTTEPAVGAEVESAETASPNVDTLLGGNELVANSIGEYLSAQWKKIRSGESGVLPVVVGLVVIVLIFQSKNGKFDSANNLVNLVDNAAIFIVLGMAEIFVLLLGDIDLSVGYNAGVGAIVTAELAAPPHNVSWILAVLAGLGVCAAFGAIQGLLITLLRLPSFIVTLAGYLGLQGVILFLFDADKHASGGSIEVNNHVLNDIVSGSLSPTASWIVMAVAVGVFAVVSIGRVQRRRRTGLVTPPLALVVVKIAATAVAGVLLVWECNKNRGGFLTTIKGVPWVVPVVLAVLVLYTFVLNRTRLGRYLYAIGGNAEAARRAGINIFLIRLTAFTLAGLTAGIGGIVYESNLGSISSNIEGGTYVLYAVAAAVIGGTSLFGGRGKMVHALLGGIVIGAIANGLALLQSGPAKEDIINAIVLLAAVTVDAVARRGRQAT